MAARRLLGQILKGYGVIHEGMIQEALVIQRDKGGRIGEILMGRDYITRADVDSAALLTEPTLQAWGIPYRRCERDQDPVEAVTSTIADAREQGRPTAVVMTRSLN